MALPCRSRSRDKVDELENETGTAMPSPDGDDDYLGAPRRFTGGPGERDPFDVSDLQQSQGFEGSNDNSVDPWDRYDGVQGAPKFFGADEPAVAWEKIGPKYRPVALGRSRER